jgi:hypothetical protein
MAPWRNTILPQLSRVVEFQVVAGPETQDLSWLLEAWVAADAK